jgi:hypothetical protein
MYNQSKCLSVCGTTYTTGMTGTTDRTEKCGITLPVSLLKQTDKVRGDIPRSTFIRRPCEPNDVPDA